jgi:uncharacterized protein (DUF302 family)
MSYTITRKFPLPMAETEARVRAALGGQGFGVLTEIDLAATMKAKLGEDMAGYKILGACNPKMAFGAIGMEPKVGTMLPCNVILRAVEGGTEVSAIDPVASMQAIPNETLKSLAGQVRDLLAKAVEAA